MRILSGLWLLLWLSPVLAAGQTMVELRTNHGVIVVQLDAGKAPKTVENFLRYVQEGFYDGTVFHRVIPGYMIQGGGYTAQNDKKEAGESIPSEADNGLKNRRGTLAMSRGTSPDSATSQFFINLADNPKLDYSPSATRYYAVFGKVVKGMEVVDKIAAVAIEMDDPAKKYAPLKSVILEKAALASGKLGAKTPPAAEPIEAEAAVTEETPAATPVEAQAAVEPEQATPPAKTGPSGKVALDQAPELPDIPAVE